MVVLAPWSSLTLPSGRAKPLVRGEGNPAACPQEESWGGATAIRPIAGGILCPCYFAHYPEWVYHGGRML